LGTIIPTFYTVYATQVVGFLKISHLYTSPKQGKGEITSSRNLPRHPTIRFQVSRESIHPFLRYRTQKVRTQVRSPVKVSWDRVSNFARIQPTVQKL